jgi:hypothetical protein
LPTTWWIRCAGEQGGGELRIIMEFLSLESWGPGLAVAEYERCAGSGGRQAERRRKMIGLLLHSLLVCSWTLKPVRNVR